MSQPAYSPAARRDLREILDYIGQHSRMARVIGRDCSATMKESGWRRIGCAGVLNCLEIDLWPKEKMALVNSGNVLKETIGKVLKLG